MLLFCRGYTYGPVGEVRVFPNLGVSRPMRRRHRVKGASAGLTKLEEASMGRGPQGAPYCGTRNPRSRMPGQAHGGPRLRAQIATRPARR